MATIHELWDNFEGRIPIFLTACITTIAKSKCTNNSQLFSRDTFPENWMLDPVTGILALGLKQNILLMDPIMPGGKQVMKIVKKALFNKLSPRYEEIPQNLSDLRKVN